MPKILLHPQIYKGYQKERESSLSSTRQCNQAGQWQLFRQYEKMKHPKLKHIHFSTSRCMWIPLELSNRIWCAMHLQKQARLNLATVSSVLRILSNRFLPEEYHHCLAKRHQLCQNQLHPFYREEIAERSE